MGAQTGEMSKLTDLMIYQRYVGGFLYFLWAELVQSARPFFSFKHILWPLSYACWANFDFGVEPHVVLMTRLLFDSYRLVFMRRRL
jgi:hypothetical protein